MRYVSASVAESLSDLHIPEPYHNIPKDQMNSIREHASLIVKDPVFTSEINRIMWAIRDDLATKDYDEVSREFLQGQVAGLRRLVEHLSSLASHK